MRKHSGIAMAVTAVTTGALALVAAAPAQAAEYRSALKIRGVQYDAPGSDSNSCANGNTDEEYLTIKNYSSSATINLKNYLVKDRTGNQFLFSANHYLQPGDHVKLRGGNGTDSDSRNVVYRDNCNFMWNNPDDTIYLYKPSRSRSDVHAYTKSGSDSDGNGYIGFHG